MVRKISVEVMSISNLEHQADGTLKGSFKARWNSGKIVSEKYLKGAPNYLKAEGVGEFFIEVRKNKIRLILEKKTKSFYRMGLIANWSNFFERIGEKFEFELLDKALFVAMEQNQDAIYQDWKTRREV